MISSQTNSKIAKGMAWTTLDRLSNHVVQFVIGIVIARFVTPKEYGVLGLLMVLITISQVFIDSGLGSALIYRANKDTKDLSTTFTFNLILSFFFFVAIYSNASWIDSFFAIPDFQTKLEVCSFILISNSIIVVPTAILKIDLNFKALALSNVTSTLTSGIAAIILAYMGFGVWALIIQQLARSLILMILVLYHCCWRPRIAFYKESFSGLYNYGVKLFITGCITKLVDESTSLFIGKFLTPYSLGLYTRGSQFASLPGSIMGSVVNSVLFPSLSQLKDNEKKFNSVFKISVIYQAAISIPLFLWLAMLSEPLIRILLTEEWIEVVPVMQILCIGRCLSPVANISEQVLMSKGRSDLMLKQQMIKMSIKFIMVICLLKYGILAVALADAIYTITQMSVTCYFLHGISDYGFVRQSRSIALFILFAMLSAAIGYIVVQSISNNYLRIIGGLSVAFVCYLIPVMSLQNEVNLKRIAGIFKKS